MAFKQVDGKLVVKRNGETIWIEPYGKDCLRFRSTMNKDIMEQDWTLLPQSRSEAQIDINSEEVRIRNGRIMAEVSEDGTVNYFTNDGKVLLEELWIDNRVNNAALLYARNYRSNGGNLYKISLYFKSYEGEHFYGMGQYANGHLNLKGSVLELAQKNTQVSIPFLISNRNYGFVWNNPAIGRVEFATNHTMWYAEAAKQIDYLIFYGETPAELVEKYVNLTGKSPMLPEWAAGFWQCKLRYRTQEELLNVAREYKRRGLPLSVIVIDFFHWPHQGDWKFDPKYWPDPEAMIKELNEMGIKLMVSIWPTVDVHSENYSDMLRKDLLVRTERGIPILLTFRGSTSFFDATNSEAREFVWHKIENNYLRYGIKEFWLDVAEPEMIPYDFDNVRYSLGNGLEVSNIYPFYYAKTFYDGMKSVGEEEIVNLIRSAWIGSQRFGVIVWSGDIPSTFESLRNQVKAGMNMAMAGIPWWTTDIGGFYGGDPEDPKFRELIVRWFQFGVFCPIFRLHGYRFPYPKDGNRCDVYELTGGPNEIWSFGEEAYKIIKELLFLREKMKPYILEQMKIAHEKGIPVMRPLFFDFPTDEVTYDIEDEYMFGPDILVAPILYEDARNRRVYLPKGVEWTETKTGKRYEGSQWIECDAPLNVIPVFSKGDSKVPINQQK